MNNITDDTKIYFSQIDNLMNESERRYKDANKDACSFMIKKIKVYINTYSLIHYSIKSNSVFADGNYDFPNLDEFNKSMQDLLQHWVSKKLNLNEKAYEVPDFSRYHAKTRRCGRRGKPSYEIDIEQVRLLREYYFSWTTISKIVGAHRSTLWRKVNKYLGNEELKYSDINDEDLDRIIMEIKKNHPLSGKRVIIGLIRSRGIHIPRARIRASIHRVDPVNAALRWIRKNPRWVYSVPGPNSLWHNDGLHKLIHWKIIIHGCIDGFSRVITYLVCESNNKASTVLKAFKLAVKRFGLPARVRGDFGTENTDLASFMRSAQGYEGAYIQGPSVHNQRIGRLHYDTMNYVLSLFINLFLFMENIFILDRTSFIDIFCIRTIFLPRIQGALDEFRDGWNHHPLSTTKNKTPYQLWMEGMMNKKLEEQRGVRTFLSNYYDTNENNDLFGVDVSGLPVAEDQNEILSFQEYHWQNEFGLKFSTVQLAINDIDPLIEDDHFGINHYLKLKEKVNEIILGA